MSRAVLGAGLALAPIAWAASLGANFALAPLACAGHGKGLLLLVSTLALSMAAAGGVLAWTQRSLNRSLALSGAVLGAFFAVVIVAQALPNLLLGGCE